ncbi:glycoside hydrolase family 3 protein [Butyrivibrio sp. AE3004]|uniref:glycoside hydrolase family 3 protein n=1 Tax=Butyrivibrio sp. AE3004 TaxID=1506994 RepID=UPI0004943B84|nr:glycoside hydrolase family 3 protein [Butyrivibrio sp. AE3004]
MSQQKYPGTTSLEISDRELSSMKTARKAAAEGIVLLKNDGILPLKESENITLYGGGASYTVKGGTGSGMVNNRNNVNITEGLRAAGFKILNEDWLADYDAEYESCREAWVQKIYDIAGTIGDFAKLYDAHASNPIIMPKGGPIVKKDTDIAIYVIARVSGEGADRKNIPGDYELSEDEFETLKCITEQYKKTIVILNVGGIIDLSFMDKLDISALVLMSQAGMEGGNALADVLKGSVNPCGKLTDTWAMKYSDYPGSADFSHNNANVIEEKYSEGIYVGYRYFDTFDVTPRYPFGFGLSYTTFEFCQTEISIYEDIITVNYNVTNIGEIPGKEVVHLYSYLPKGERHKENKRLVAFAKTGILNPGQSQTLSLSFSCYLLASYHTARSQYFLDAGRYILESQICDSCGYLKKRRESALLLQKKTVLSTLSPICPLLDSLKEMVPSDPVPQKRDELSARTDSPTAYKQNDPYAFTDISDIDIENAVTSYIEKDRLLRANIKKNHISFSKQATEVLAKMTADEKARLVCGQPSVMSGEIIGSAAMTIPGAAGETFNGLKHLGIGHLILADGPAGIRLQKHYQVNPEDGSIYKMNRYESLENRIFGKEFLHPEGEDHYMFCTAIPVGTALAQTFDVAIIEEIGDLIGTEMEEMGVQLWLAPGMNIHRNPLCGRNFEYYSEDPLVSGLMAAAITRGVSSHKNCAVTIKHFACNNQEENRRGVSSIVSERALREIYLKGFEIVVKEADPKAIMTSYNKVNGVHSANNYDLCTTAARDEWGFSGIIMTDWLTTNANGGSAATKCIEAGNDLIMPGNNSDIQEILDALEKKKDLALSMEALDTCCHRILSVILQLTS